MFELLITLLLAIPALLFWSAGRSAAERATDLGRRACERAGVQWLDQTVHQTRLRLRRNTRGRLAWERHFRFEYSTAGRDRHDGMVILVGSELTGLVGPMPGAESVH